VDATDQQQEEQTMWIITPIGFFSIVQKPGDIAVGTLTVRARVRSDLEALKAAVLPGLGPIAESKSTDYRYRATAPRALVEAAMGKLAAQLDYANFKNQVAKVQGAKRANLYHDVWDVLHRMQGDPGYELKATKPAVAPAAIQVPKADAYGGVLFDAQGRTLLREPANHFGGYVWTFAKGKPDKGESPEQTALREVLEETGYTCRVVGVIPKVFPGTTSSTAFFLMEPVDEPGLFSEETAQTRWVSLDEATSLIQLTKVAAGMKRDLAVVVAAFEAWAEHKASGC
jgi:8-oxo-dGTP pyrophosphatase MutT (NUDIX family)